MRRSASLRAGCERAPQPAGLTREREHRSVVVDVGVDVEQPRAARGEGLADRVQDRAVPPLGDVGHGDERSHAASRTLPPAAGATATDRRRARSGCGCGGTSSWRAATRSTSVISMVANAAPGHRRAPPPNGIHA